MEAEIPKPQELHPMLVHFLIGFLLGGVVLLLWASWRPNETRHRAAAGLLLAGMILGWLEEAAGGLAYFTVPPCHKRVLARFPRVFEDIDETEFISGMIISLC